MAKAGESDRTRHLSVAQRRSYTRCSRHLVAAVEIAPLHNLHQDALDALSIQAIVPCARHVASTPDESPDIFRRLRVEVPGLSTPHASPRASRTCVRSG